jgi:uncharacterized protein (TIRG00374 family)
MRRIEIIFLILGLALFIFLLDRIGWRLILSQLENVGWAFALVLVVSAGRYLARTVAWRYAFSAGRELPSFLEMFQARLAGQSLGYLTFAGPLLSEPVKAGLLREQVPLKVGLGGAVLEAASYSVTSTVIMVVGLALGLVVLGLDAGTRLAAGLLVALLLLLLLGLRWVLAHRLHVVAGLLGALARTPLRRWTEPQRPRLENAEQALLDFYARHAGRFRLMFLWDFASQGFALLEIYVILRAMGLEAGWVDVLIIETLSKVISTVFFFVPGRVGTEEGGLAGVCALLGFGAARGVSLALVQRLRAVIWSALGLLILSRYAARKAA